MPANTAAYYPLIVSQIKRLAKDSVKISFTLPKGLEDIFTFYPGQYILIKLKYNKEYLYRNYSICSGPGEGISIAVKALPHGKVSRYLNEVLNEGDTVMVSAPRGSFILDESAQQIVLIGAGSGITPLISMYKYALAGAKTPILLYGNRNEDSMMFCEEVSEMEKTRTFLFFSGERKPDTFYGRIDATNLDLVTKTNPSILDANAFYICGPNDMIETTCRFLKGKGIAEENIHFERFTTSAETEGKAPQPDTNFSDNCHLTIRLDGETSHITIKPDSISLLENILKAGIDAPFSCKSGVCGSCRAKLKTGKVSVLANYALTPEELEQGYILTCKALAASAEISINYDA
jgi:ring-1,2-phenylacetyl-CoA epoxidase subunit PaaE